MIDAILGAVIMVVATSSLLLAVEVAELAFSKAGRYELNDDERVLLDGLAQQHRHSNDMLEMIDGVEDQLQNQLPTQYQRDDGI